MYELRIKPEVDKIFYKLSKKNPQLLKLIAKKIEDIQNNPHHKYKFLKKPLQNLNRIHIGHFVLIFKINHKDKAIEIFHFNHHDSAYK